MKKILIVAFLLLGITNIYANVKVEKDYTKINFSKSELQGEWLKIDCPVFKVMVNKIDFGEKKYQKLTFIDNMYLYVSTDDKNIFLKKRKIFNYNDFVLKESDTPNQWLGLYTNGSFFYFGITKINEKTKIKKVIKGHTIADWRVGDMILTLYNNKTNEIVYRLQYRKIK